jgi:hypothetical protein
LIKALKALSLAFSTFSLAFSRLSCSISLSIRFVRSSISRTGRQFGTPEKVRLIAAQLVSVIESR